LAATSAPTRNPEVHQDGKFVAQYGKSGPEQGQQRHRELRPPGEDLHRPKNNEAYIADGYGNKRVASRRDTGKFKRYWGAYGNKPDDTNSAPTIPTRRRCSSSARRCIARTVRRRPRLRLRSAEQPLQCSRRTASS
jgi:hypothetical protein